MEPDKPSEIVWSDRTDQQDFSENEITVCGKNLSDENSITIDVDKLVLHGTGLSTSDYIKQMSIAGSPITVHYDDSVDAIASSVYDKISEKIKLENNEEIDKLKEDLKTLLDLKIKTLPAISTGVYLIEFEDGTFSYKKKDILENLKKKIDERYKNDSILLCGINKLERITEESLDEKIKNLIKLKEELKKNGKF